MGAAYATVVSEVLFFIFFFVFLPGRFRYLPWAKIGKSMISSAIMGVLIIFMIKNGLTLPSIIVVGAIIYSICVWVTGYITRDEKAELQKIFQGKNAQ
jgi:peptidoglycan biosynthesis protein MviN/MurJ (putative lipid II flippase)